MVDIPAVQGLVALWDEVSFRHLPLASALLIQQFESLLQVDKWVPLWLERLSA